MFLGTSVLLSAQITIVGGGNPSSVTVSILAPDGTIPVLNQAATYNSGTGTWQYIYQSGSNGSGQYTAQWKSVYGSNAGKTESTFALRPTSL